MHSKVKYHITGCIESECLKCSLCVPEWFSLQSQSKHVGVFDVITTGDDGKVEGQGFNLQSKLDVDGILDDFKNSCLHFFKA